MTWFALRHWERIPDPPYRLNAKWMFFTSVFKAVFLDGLDFIALAIITATLAYRKNPVWQAFEQASLTMVAVILVLLWAGSAKLSYTLSKRTNLALVARSGGYTCKYYFFLTWGS